ncbi:MAG: hypothetical protein WC462_01375 [archaeon]
MDEKETKREVTEAQLTQMARQEENSLMTKQAVLEKISSMLKDTLNAKDILKEVQKTNGKVLINIGATILIEAEAKDIKKCKRGFAENAYKEENLEETLKWLEKKEDQLQKQLTKLGQEYSEAQQRLTSIIGILKQIDSEKRKLIEQRKRQPITISK